MFKKMAIIVASVFVLASCGQTSITAIFSDDGDTSGGNTDQTTGTELLIPGSLDTSFSGDGLVFAPTGSYNSDIYCNVVQPDGKIIFAGRVVNDPAGWMGGFMLARYNADGSLDEDFGTDGVVITNIGLDYNQVNAVTLQPDGKIVAVGITNGNTQPIVAIARYNTDGSLDTSFDADGIVTTDFLGGTYSSGATSVFIQSSVMGSKILIGGYLGDSAVPNSADFLVARYNSNGSLDVSFDGDGWLTTDFGLEDRSTKGVMQSDGKLVLAGFSNVLGFGSAAVARYNTDTDGSLDVSVNTVVGGMNPAYPQAVTIEPSTNNIVVAGVYAGGADDSSFIIRYDSSLALDVSFNPTGITPGILVVDLSAAGVADAINDIRISSTGKMLTAGMYQSPSGFNQGFVARFNNDGSSDTSFNLTGLVGLTSTPFMSSLNSVLLGSDGSVMAGGSSSNGSNSDFAVVKYTSAGQMEESFANRGYVITKAVGFAQEARAMALQADGKVILAGRTNSLGFNTSSILRFNTDGTLDYTFGSGGEVAGTTDVFNGVAVQADGKIVAVGNSDPGIVVARFNTDGSLDSSFNGGGTTYLASGDKAEVNGVILQPDGKIIICGYSWRLLPNRYSFLLARYNTNGTLDVTFDADGVVVLNVASDNDIAYSLALQADGKIVVTGKTDGGYAVARLDSSGTPDASFDVDGKVSTPLGTSAVPRKVSITGDGDILVAGVVYDGADGTFVLTKYKAADGSLDPTFGIAGIVELSCSTSGTTILTNAALQSDGKILLSGTIGTSSVLMRADEDGAVDLEFGSEGSGITDLSSSGIDSLYAIVPQEDRIFIAGASTQKFALAKLIQ